MRNDMYWSIGSIDQLRSTANETLAEFVNRSFSDDTNESIAEALTNELHGSGFDGKWSVIRHKSGNVLCRIDYHAMDENGYYDGWFTINVLASPTLDVINITFTVDSRMRRKYISYQDDYYCDTIREAFKDLRSSILLGTYDFKPLL